MTKRHKWLWILLSVFVLLSSGACNGSKSSGTNQAAGNTSATLNVAFDTQTSQTSKLRAMRAAKGKGLFATTVIGTIDDIASITVDVQSDSGYIVQGAALTNNGNGSWSATINDLPVGVRLTFTGHAYNSSPAEIFTGTTLQVLMGADDRVVIAMAPVSNGETLTIPRITQISRPAEIVVNSAVPVSISVQGSDGETLSYQVTPAADGGAFDPVTGSITMNGTTATIVLNYTAPAVVGTYSHAIRVTNSLGNSVQTNFDTNVVSQLTSSAVVVQFNPVILSVAAARSGSDVTFAATVSDSGPATELSYNWRFTGSLLFADPAVNPAVLQGYDESVSGTLSLTVTNASQGRTTVSYAVNPGQFPDVVVNNIALLPQVANYTGISDCRAGGVSGNIVTLSMEESGDQTDYNNDGDLDDRVLGYLDVSTNSMVNTGITLGARSVAIHGDIMAYVKADTGTIGWYSISAQTGHDTGMTADAFDRDYWGVARVVSSGRIAYVAGGVLNIYDTVSLQNTPTGVAVPDPLTPSFSGDIVAFVGPAGTIAYYNVATGVTTDTDVPGAYPTIDNGIIVFDTPSAEVAYYDISKGTSASTPIHTHRDYASISNGIIAAGAIEDASTGDLNGDGVIDGSTILVLYDIATNRLVSTGVKVCCIPDISGWLIAYDGNNGCEQWYVVLDASIRQYFGR